ncbi:MAG: helix-turn-helix domain-containing protein [Chloroflexota bacterium]
MTELGEMLRAARQKRGLSLSEAAAATRIQAAYLDAIENGDYSILPGAAYATGFIKNYARYLGIHPDDALQDYHGRGYTAQPAVRAATRVLATGYESHNRTRLLWTLGAVFLLLVGGFAIKQYSDSVHAYAPPLNVTPANLGTGSVSQLRTAAHTNFQLGLRASAPVWVRVRADGAKVFEGILRPHRRFKTWSAHRTIYVITMNGANLSVQYNHRRLGPFAAQPGLTVKVATPSGWQNAA